MKTHAFHRARFYEFQTVVLLPRRTDIGPLSTPGAQTGSLAVVQVSQSYLKD
jgi:hypothetical protein